MEYEKERYRKIESKISMTCPLCRGKAQDWFIQRPSYFRQKTKFLYWYCKDCNLSWIKKVPKIEYDQSYYKAKSSFVNKLFTPIALTFYFIRRGYIGNKNKIGTYIDVGAGAGEFLKVVKADTRIGVEVSSSGRELMKKAGLKTMTNKEFLKSTSFNADVISFWNILEHVKNPWDYLKAGRRNLAKNGEIIIGIPNLDSLDLKVTRDYWFHLQPLFHIWHFSPKALKVLLKKTGFNVKTIDYWAIEHHLTGTLQSFINRSANSRENVLHKLIKRSAGGGRFQGKDVIWSLFWLTIGLPIVIIFWIIASVAGKSGTMVVVAKPSNRNL